MFILRRTRNMQNLKAQVLEHIVTFITCWDTTHKSQGLQSPYVKSGPWTSAYIMKTIRVHNPAAQGCGSPSSFSFWLTGARGGWEGASCGFCSGSPLWQRAVKWCPGNGQTPGTDCSASYSSGSARDKQTHSCGGPQKASPSQLSSRFKKIEALS